MTEVLLIGGHRSTVRSVAGLTDRLARSGFTVHVAYAPGADRDDAADLDSDGGLDSDTGSDAASGVDAAPSGVTVPKPRPLRMSLTGRRGGVPLRRLSAPWGRVVARNAAVRAWLRVAGPARRTWLLARYDPWLRRTAKRSSIVLAADDDATLAAERMKVYNPDAVVLHVKDPRLDATISRAQAVIPLQRLLRNSSRPRPSGADASSRADEVVRAWREVEADPNAPHLRGFVAEAIRIVRALRRTNDFDAAETVALSALGLVTSVTEADRLRLQLATVRSARGDLPAELAEAVRCVLRHADESLRRGRTDEVAALVIDVVDALFNRELHADVLWSPLVSDPALFLAPLRESLTFRVLGAPAGSMAGVLADTVPAARQEPAAVDAAGTERRTAAQPAPARPRRVLVVPGDYPNFTRGIIDSFDDDPEIDLRVLHLREPGGPPRRFHRGALIADRLNSATGRAVPELPAHDTELLGWADTIFVDWCDNAAQWTVMHAPPGARIVVRFHSLEAISHQPHMIDWSRVSEVIFVGHHVRQLVERAVPGIAAAGRIHVVPNEMRLARFGLPKRAIAERTIAMVGWAQRVKDPLWALEVLARLRASDPSWCLLLFGNDFSDAQHLGALRYRDRFRARAAADDVRDGIVFAGYTSDLPEALRDVGFVLSASRREGFPVGITEGAASAAVPIIRDWPMYADYDGARGIFPADWVVDRTEQAAERILAYADADKRTQAGTDARDYVVERYDWSVVEPRFRAVVLGP